MPDQVQLRGGSKEENDGFVGADREVTVDTSSHTLRVHDGSTTGGHPLASGTSSTDPEPDTLVQRDAWGRAQVADPVDDADVANKNYVDGQFGDSVAVEVIDEIEIEGSAAATIVFDDIPQTYRDLELVIYGRSTRAATTDGLLIRFNDDTANNYDRQRGRFEGGTTNPVGNIGLSRIELCAIPGGNSVADTPGQYDVVIANYRNTAFHKTLRSLGSVKWANETREHASGVHHGLVAVHRSDHAHRSVLDRWGFRCGDRCSPSRKKGSGMSDVVIARRGEIERRPMTPAEVEQRESDAAAGALRESEHVEAPTADAILAAILDPDVKDLDALRARATSADDDREEPRHKAA